MIFVKGIVVGDSVCKLNVNRWGSGFHQFQIHKKSACSAVAVDKWVDALKLNMKPRQLRDDVFIAFRTRMSSTRQKIYFCKSRNPKLSIDFDSLGFLFLCIVPI